MDEQPIEREALDDIDQQTGRCNGLPDSIDLAIQTDDLVRDHRADESVPGEYSGSIRMWSLP